MRKLLHVFLALFLLAGAAQAKDSLVIGVAQFPNSLHPYISSQTVQFYSIGFAQRPISSYDSAGHRVCLLCATLPTLENGLAKVEDLPSGGKGLAVTIKLRPGLAWGDGQPVTAKDILFTWKLARQPSSGFITLYDWGRATKVDVVDDSTVVMHLDKTYATYQIWDYILPEHLEAQFVGTGPDAALNYINHTLYAAAPTTPGLWDGPYMLSAYHPGNSIELVPNPHWPGPKPAIQHVVVRLVEDTSALQANLLSGDVDMSPSGIGITTDQAVALERSHGKDFQFFYRKGLSLERLAVQLDNKLLSDVRVRQALLLALDRKTLLTRLFGGHASLANTWINDLEPNYTTEGVTTYPYDPAKARALLTEAGYTPGPDGIRRNAAGDRLSFEFATTSGNRVRELSQQVIQSWLKAVGVEVQIKNQPSRTFFGELMRKRSYTGLTEWAGASQVGLSPTPYFDSAAIPTKANNYSGHNWAGFSNPEMDRAARAAETELDPAKQKALWATMQRLYADNLPELPLYFRQDPDIVPAWLKGYQATGREICQTWFAENWHP